MVARQDVLEPSHDLSTTLLHAGKLVSIPRRETVKECAEQISLERSRSLSVHEAGLGFGNAASLPMLPQQLRRKGRRGLNNFGRLRRPQFHARPLDTRRKILSRQRDEAPAGRSNSALMQRRTAAV